MCKMYILDAGHSGTPDPGAVGPGGTRESDRALEIVLKVKTLLMRRNIPVMLTREMYDQPVTDDLAYRVNIANTYAAAALVSIHCNAAENPAATGLEIWTSPGQTASDTLAEAMLQAYDHYLPGLYQRKDLSDGDGDKEARFYVLTQTDCPAVLIETGFITNPEEEAQLATDAYQWLHAQAIVDGILAWEG